MEPCSASKVRGYVDVPMSIVWLTEYSFSALYKYLPGSSENSEALESEEMQMWLLHGL